MKLQQAYDSLMQRVTESQCLSNCLSTVCSFTQPGVALNQTALSHASWQPAPARAHKCQCWLCEEVTTLHK